MPAHTLYILDCGYLDDPQPNGEIQRVPVPAYLIRTDTGRVYLVDTGNPETLIGASKCEPWYPATCEITAAHDPIAGLAELGLRPRDVDAIIATHFDFDHAGRYDAFGPLGTDVYVQRAHMAAALSFPARFDPALWRVPGLRWRLVDGDQEVEPGLTLLRTDGHVVGHQSLLVETADGPVILAIDAIDNERMIHERRFPDTFDVERTNESIDRLIRLRDEIGAVILYGHDLAQWNAIRRSPEAFRLG